MKHPNAKKQTYELEAEIKRLSVGLGEMGKRFKRNALLE
jgi:hypothetical protein